MDTLSLIIPPFLDASKVLLAALASEAAITSISLLIDAATKQKHEKQLRECLERAFKQTKKQLNWTIKEKTAFATFQSSLVSFVGSFDHDSLKIILGTAVGKDVSNAEVELWIDNLLKQLSLNEHDALREYLKLRHILVDLTERKSTEAQTQASLDYLLTYTTPVWDNKDVICRDDIIKDLFDKFSTGVRRIQVAGMGGLGKTEILVKLFFQLTQPNPPAQFDYIGYIQFKGDLESDFRLHIPYLAEYAKNHGEAEAKLFLQQLCSTNRVLFCIDDDRDKKDIFKKDDPNLAFLKTLTASILFASRTEYSVFEQQDLPPLSTEACIEIFQHMYGQEVHDPKDLEILTKIIEDLSGNNTLIVNRLGTIAKEHNYTITELQEDLIEKNFHIKKGCVDEEKLQQEISKLYPLSDLANQAERSIVEAFSIFPASPLSVDLCVEWLHEDAGVNEEDCSLALTKLSKQRWLDKRTNVTDGKVIFSMHQCVKSAVKDQTPVEHSSHQGLVEKCGANLNKSTVAYLLQNSSLMIPFAVQVHDILFHETKPFALLSAAIASFYNKSADYNASLVWYQKSLTVKEKVLGKDHPDTAITYNNIAGVYNNQGQYDLALEWYLKDLAISEKVLGKDHPDTATTYNNIAGVYDSQGQYDLALEWYQKSLTVKEKVLGKDHPSTATTYNNIAGVYYSQGQYDLALEWYQKALSIFQRVLGEDHPYTATTYNNIALVYKTQGKYDLALEWNQKALVIREKVLGEDHPYAAITYNNIAGVYKMQGQYDLALEWNQKALSVKENLLGKEHPSTATSYCNIASIYSYQGKHDLALEWYQKALAIVIKVLGEDHPNTIMIKKNIAYLKANS
jgi:tetratricopeptide (TPR) repeat protein